MDIKKRLLLLLLCFISIVPSIAQRDHIDISNDILCINSYAESSPWSNRTRSPRETEYVQKDPQLALYAEHMNMLMIENDSTHGRIQTVDFSKILGKDTVPVYLFCWEIPPFIDAR